MKFVCVAIICCLDSCNKEKTSMRLDKFVVQFFNIGVVCCQICSLVLTGTGILYLLVLFVHLIR